MLEGDVHYKVGDNVNSKDIVASTKIPGNVHMVNISKQLNIDPLFCFIVVNRDCAILCRSK